MDAIQHNHSPQSSGVLRNEIQMIRGIMQRVMPLINEGCSLQEMLKLLDSLSMASTRLATLLKTDLQLSQKDDLADALNEALAEMLDEMNQET
ncbi:MAG: hypothetical protein J7K85_08785 [Anaerolineaceae bacterium]|nr:hypothetical protein [Anaerolineaceae bacterium]